jgi:hypothetical protein
VVIRDRLEHHRSKALVQLQDALNLPLDPLRADRVGTDDEDHGIGLLDETEKLALPLLQ